MTKENLKALRQELETRLEEQLPQEMMNAGERLSVEQAAASEVTDPAQAKRIIEALLFASTKPLTAAEIQRVLKSFSEAGIKGQIAALKDELAAGERSFEIVEIAGGYEMATRKTFAPWILKMELQKKAKQVTQSALETLAILAYKQPVTRAEIEELRGVDVSGVISTLMERGLVRITGKKEVPGRPFLYGTTDKFLTHFGLGGLKDLPNIDEIKTLVESSVRREELLGRPQVLDAAAEETQANENEGENTEDHEEKQDALGNPKED